MNAPAKKTDLAPQSAYQLIAIGDTFPSTTHIQQLRRARFDPAAMAELVVSVTAHGVLQPIVVRRSDNVGEGCWEIVAGERRWIAARSAKLGFIPAVCRELTDLQVLEIQLVENLQREGLHPLEEAEGFADLMKLKGVNAEAIAETIGRSRSHVFGRLKLLDLIPAARDAFNTGAIDASKAQLIARIPLPKLQAKALKMAQEADWRGEPPAFRDFKRQIEAGNNKFTVELKHARFRLADATLLTYGGSCIDCPKRTGNLGDLFADVKNPDVCTDPDCFDKKQALYQKRLIAEAKTKGRTIISGDAAKAIAPAQYTLLGHIDLDATADEEFSEPEPPVGDEDDPSPAWKAWQAREAEFVPRTYRQILGDAGAAAAVLLDKGKELREIVPIAEAKKLLKPFGITLPPWADRKPDSVTARPTGTADRGAEEEKLHERRDREEQFRRALLAQIHAKFKGPFKHEDLVTIAAMELGGIDTQALQEVCYGGKHIEPAKMNDADLTRLLVELTVSQAVEYLDDSPGPLLALAKRCKIDPVKVKKDLAAAAKAKDKPAPAKAPAKKKAVKK